MPDKIKDALVDTLVIIGCHHLGVVMNLTVTLRVALVLHMTTVAQS